MKIKDEAVLAKITEGATIDDLVSWLSPEEQLICFGWLKEHGAKVSPNSVLEKTLQVVLTGEQIKVLLNLGANPLLLAEKLPSKLLMNNLEILLSYGLEPEKVYKNLMHPRDVMENLRFLAKLGISIPQSDLERIKDLARRR